MIITWSSPDPKTIGNGERNRQLCEPENDGVHQNSRVSSSVPEQLRLQGCRTR